MEKQTPQTTVSTNATFDLIKYNYQDASVPPKYHRSYTININAIETKTEVFVYSADPLASETKKTDAKNWEALNTLSTKLEPANKKVNQGATGTSTCQLRLYKGDKMVYELIWDSLNEINPESKPMIEAVIASVESLEKLCATQLKKED